MSSKKIVIERTKDLIYLKFVATDFSPKIISPSAGETPVTQHNPCCSAVSALLMNPLPDRSNYSPLCHTHYLTPDQYFKSLQARPFTKPRAGSMLKRFTAEYSRELSALRKLNNKQKQVLMFLILLFKLLTQLPFVSFLFLCSLSQS